jgi:hypothetical protein
MLAETRERKRPADDSGLRRGGREFEVAVRSDLGLIYRVPLYQRGFWKLLTGAICVKARSLVEATIWFRYERDFNWNAVDLLGSTFCIRPTSPSTP